MKISTEFTPLPLHWEHRTAPVNQTWHNKTKISNCRYFLLFLSSSKYDAKGAWIRDVHISYNYCLLQLCETWLFYMFWLDHHVFGYQFHLIKLFNTSLKLTLLLWLCIESVKPPNTTLTYLKVFEEWKKEQGKTLCIYYPRNSDDNYHFHHSQHKSHYSVLCFGLCFGCLLQPTWIETDNYVS